MPRLHPVHAINSVQSSMYCSISLQPVLDSFNISREGRFPYVSILESGIPPTAKDNKEAVVPLTIRLTKTLENMTPCQTVSPGLVSNGYR